VAPPVPDRSRNKQGYLQDLPTWAPAAVQGAAHYGGYLQDSSRACARRARPWDWLPCDWIRPITKEATSKTRRVRPWDWLPCDWMRPITKEDTSKTHPHYDSLLNSSFLRLPSPMGLMVLNHRGKTATFGFLSRLYSLAGLELRDRRDCWSFGVSFLFVPCPLK
jgi:hypothetical protein